MQYFTCYLLPNGKYKNFKTSIFLDSSAGSPMTINFRKDKYDGEVIKTITIKPGETLENIDIEIGGINKLCLETEAKIDHGNIKKLVYGETIFYNEPTR